MLGGAFRIAAALTVGIATSLPPVVAHATSRAPAPPLPVIGLTVPWAVGGARIEADGTLRDFPGEWPTIPFESVRMWDTRTAWLNIEPRDDRWDFTRLDAFVAKARAHGVTDISLVLGGTPRWAATQTRPTDAPWMGPGSASPPRDMSEWAEFVTMVAERYRGRITSYEIWNEPDNVVFWSGSRARWVQLVGVAARAIQDADPSATIVASGFRIRSPRDVARVAPWITALRPIAPMVDAVSVHWYPQAGTEMSVVSGVLAAVGEQARVAGITGRPWITELNVRDGNSLSSRAQATAVAELTRAAADAGRITWYAWTDLGPRDLMPLYPRTPAAVAMAVTTR